MTTNVDHARASRDVSRRYVVVSSDGHAGPSLEHSLRPYCPSTHIEAFDDFVSAFRRGDFASGRHDHEMTDVDKLLYGASFAPDAVGGSGSVSALLPVGSRDVLDQYAQCRGNDDATVRLAHMDDEGIAAELIFSGGQNAEMLPFGVGFGTGAGAPGVDPELRAVGQHIWNAWLVDHVATDPARLVGVMQMPVWDVDRAIAEIRWCAERGLRAVNFPSPRTDFAPYNDPRYDRLWHVCVELGLPLVTHTGGGDDPLGSQGPGGEALTAYERPWLARRGLAQLMFGGVFERHPELKVVWTEMRVGWVADTVAALDELYTSNICRTVRSEVPKAPSEYWSTNCFNSGSFLARFEVDRREDVGIGNLFFGRDYPHIEGTWPHTDLALRNTFAGVPEDDTRRILGLNAIPVYGLDATTLRRVADRIGPWPEEVNVPLRRDELPDHRGFAYRTRNENE
jgi:predicted TIM-barrel fold metal-dependent hydrolase